MVGVITPVCHLDGVCVFGGGGLLRDDPFVVDHFYLHSTRTVHYTLCVQQQAYMRHTTVIVVKEHQITGLSLTQSLYNCTLCDLLSGVAQQVVTKQRVYRLREARAINSHGILAAP